MDDRGLGGISSFEREGYDRSVPQGFPGNPDMVYDSKGNPVPKLSFSERSPPIFDIERPVYNENGKLEVGEGGQVVIDFNEDGGVRREP